MSQFSFFPTREDQSIFQSSVNVPITRETFLSLLQFSRVNNVCCVTWSGIEINVLDGYMDGIFEGAGLEMQNACFLVVRIKLLVLISSHFVREKIERS